MTTLTDTQIEKAAEIVKILYLARQPGMDTVAIKLNRRPTYEEKQVARKWADIFELAQSDETAWNCAAEYAEKNR